MPQTDKADMSKPAAAQTPLDRFLPERYRDADPETQRKARLCLAFVAFMETQVVTFAVLYACLGLPQVSEMVTFAGVLMLFTPKALARSLEGGTNYFIAIVFGILLPVAYYTGGLHAPAAWWFMSTPVLGMMLGGRRVAIGWTIGTAIVGVVATVLTLAGFDWPHPLGATPDAVLDLIGFTALAGVMLALAMLHEQANQRMMQGLDAANHDMRIVLENLREGFLVVGRTGGLAERRSVVLDRWFGPTEPTDTLWSWLGRSNPELGAWLPLAWSAVFEDVLPMELALDQLPKRFAVGDRLYALAYRPLRGSETSKDQLLVVIYDVTRQVAAERAEETHREVMTACEKLADDRAGFLQFSREATALVDGLAPGQPSLLRQIHTLKGNAAIFGVRSVAAACHAVESAAQERGTSPTASELETIRAAWSAFSSRISTLLDHDATRLEVEAADVQALRGAIDARAPYPILGEMVDEWQYERAEKVLGRVAEQALGLADRLGRGRIVVDIDHGDVRLDGQRWSGVWSAFIHAVRNAVDHGLESPVERSEAGKTEPPTLRLSARSADDTVTVEISDNGRGVDWARVAAKASAAGLPTATERDLVEALFSDGLSTKEEVSEYSGRGVGLSALRAAAVDLGGDVQLRSEPGRGTRLTVRVPQARPQSLAA